MERTIKCFKFQLIRLIKLTAVFTAIYVVVNIFMLLILTLQTQKGTADMSCWFSAIFFAFIICAVLYKSTFNSLLIFGNTRRTILASFYLCVTAFSVMLTILSELGELLNDGMSHMSLSSFRLIYSIYIGINAPQKLLWFFTLFLMVVMIGFVYGALNYKFGKIFKIAFWCGFGFLSMLSSLLSNAGILAAVSKAAKEFFGFRMSGGVYWCSLHFFIVAAALGVILWLLARRQPQNA